MLSLLDAIAMTVCGPLGYAVGSLTRSRFTRERVAFLNTALEEQVSKIEEFAIYQPSVVAEVFVAPPPTAVWRVLWSDAEVLIMHFYECILVPFTKYISSFRLGSRYPQAEAIFAYLWAGTLSKYATGLQTIFSMVEAYSSFQDLVTDCRSQIHIIIHCGLLLCLAYSVVLYYFFPRNIRLRPSNSKNGSMRIATRNRNIDLLDVMRSARRDFVDVTLDGRGISLNVRVRTLERQVAELNRLLLRERRRVTASSNHPRPYADPDAETDDSGLTIADENISAIVNVASAPVERLLVDHLNQVEPDVECDNRSSESTPVSPPSPYPSPERIQFLAV
ncbi:hypothetical protein SISNIDRAFT_483176 [Sistotremastrum niveocremeum HHB9708]|uniref:Uncharacterized protein n=1 Tax=Sistotremastrum niveocremeum HHB9708 TaxID=1314777 RepID=A0A164X8X1_9AGAM|nr:hypothetical protein SISNIDRAFT_483176 [Sistotremastrum niveocremeum HHB9708]